MRVDCFDVGRAGQLGADYRFVSTILGGLPSACLAVIVAGIILVLGLGQVSRTVAQFGIQLAVNAAVASVLIIPMSYVLLYVPVRLMSLIAILYGVIGIVTAPLLILSGFWPVNIFTALPFYNVDTLAFQAAWLITTLAYLAAVPIFLIVAVFGLKALFSSHRAHKAIRSPLPKFWHPLSVLKYIFGISAAYGWSWNLVLARSFFAAGLVCLFYSLYNSATRLGYLTEACFVDANGRAIDLGSIRAHYQQCLLGVDSAAAMTVVLNAGMGVVIGAAGILIGRSFYEEFLNNRSGSFGDARGNILFLRPFGEDGRSFKDQTKRSTWAFFDLVDRAENFARLLDQTVSELGSTVAVASPSRASIGGVTVREIRLRDEEWQAAVERMSMTSDAIVFVDGEGEGIAWERNMLLGQGYYKKTLFLFGLNGSWATAESVIRGTHNEDAAILKKISTLANRRRQPIGLHISDSTICLYHARSREMGAYHAAILDFCNLSGLRSPRVASNSRSDVTDDVDGVNVGRLPSG